jgi:hypothetical protein
MEVGNSKEVWFKSCVDLVISRFFATDFGRLSITGIQVLKVTRIHNRFLQDRFERILDAQVLQMQKGSKMHVEYLLYGEMLQAPDELQWIIEEGFPFAPEHVPNGSQGPVVLSNSVGLADMCRLQVYPFFSTLVSTNFIYILMQRCMPEETCISLLWLFMS